MRKVTPCITQQADRLARDDIDAVGAGNHRMGPRRLGDGGGARRAQREIVRGKNEAAVLAARTTIEQIHSHGGVRNGIQFRENHVHRIAYAVRLRADLNAVERIAGGAVTGGVVSVNVGKSGVHEQCVGISTVVRAQPVGRVELAVVHRVIHHQEEVVRANIGRRGAPRHHGDGVDAIPRIGVDIAVGNGIQHAPVGQEPGDAPLAVRASGVARDRLRRPHPVALSREAILIGNDILHVPT